MDSRSFLCLWAWFDNGGRLRDAPQWLDHPCLWRGHEARADPSRADILPTRRLAMAESTWALASTGTERNPRLRSKFAHHGLWPVRHSVCFLTLWAPAWSAGRFRLRSTSANVRQTNAELPRNPRRHVLIVRPCPVRSGRHSVALAGVY